MYIVANRKIFYAITALRSVASLGTHLIIGLNFGIDFKGGSIVEVEYTGERPTVEELSALLDTEETFRGYSVRPTGAQGHIVRTPYLEGTAHTELLNLLSESGQAPLVEKRFDNIGPTIGKELTVKALISILLVMLAIVLFIAFVFR